MVNLVLEHLPVFTFPHSKLDALILLEESTKELLPVNLRLLGKEVIKLVFQIVLSEFSHRVFCLFCLFIVCIFTSAITTAITTAKCVAEVAFGGR